MGFVALTDVSTTYVYPVCTSYIVFKYHSFLFYREADGFTFFSLCIYTPFFFFFFEEFVICPLSSWSAVFSHMVYTFSSTLVLRLFFLLCFGSVHMLYFTCNQL